MIDYVFTRAHRLDRVDYVAGNEIQRTARMGDWLIAQGVPLRRKVAAAAPTAPVMPAPIDPPALRAYAAPARGFRPKCCGWK